MSDMIDMIRIGMSSLIAYQQALTVAGNNIANASDPNYAMRRINLQENGNGFGVNVADIARVVDVNAVQFAQVTNMNYSMMSEYSSQMQSLSQLFSDSSTGLGKSITDSLSALTNLSATPADAGGRNSYLAKLSYVAQQLQFTVGQIDTNALHANQDLAAQTADINQLLSNIANVNQQIQNSPGQDHGALLDSRDSFVNKLSGYLDFTTTTSTDGVININLSNGLSLVNGVDPAKLKTYQDPTNVKNLLVGLESGTSTIDLSNIIKGGSVAGIYTARQNADQARISINRLALAISQSFNAQNQQGIDKNGNFGGNIFTDINSANAIGNRVIGNTINTGSGNFTVNITNISQLQASDYSFVVGASNSYTLRRLSDNTVVSSGTISGTFPQTISVDGFSMNLTGGTYNAGDQYLVSPTSNASKNMSVILNDGSKLALAFPVVGAASTQNKGNAALVVNAITNPSNSSFATPNQLSPPIKVVFDSTATHYTLINATTNATIEGPIAYNASNGTGVNIFPTPGGYDPGYTISITGTAAANDSFTINYNTANSTDFSNGTAMQNLYSTQILDGGTATFNQAYNALINVVYTQTQDAQNKSTIAQKLNDAASTARDDISGVSLPGEAMNMQQFQQAYQASAQILQVARSTFESLLSMFR